MVLKINCEIDGELSIFQEKVFPFWDNDCNKILIVIEWNPFIINQNLQKKI
jgi:hypothetical protein